MKTEYQYVAVETPDKIKNGQIIRELRWQRDMSLRQLAEALDVSSPYLSDLELGNRGFSEAMFERAKTEIAKFNRKK